MNTPTSANVLEWSHFDTVIDARSPAEFAHDHLPGALSCPVLDDDERARIGTMYSQDSPFAARRLGGAWAAQHIGHHIETLWQDKPKSWRPLVYCWRAGQRSASFVHVLRAIGWDARQLEGGYRAWRRYVLQELDRLPVALSFRVLCGPTGSGKSALLAALRAAGAPVLDLEALAGHRGSLLGALPQVRQPSQCAFETMLAMALVAHERTAGHMPLFVEAESRRIGAVQLPNALMARLRDSPCLELVVPLAARVDDLLREYAHFLADSAPLREQLARLREIRGNALVNAWIARIDRGEFPALVAELLAQHYDPLYQRSQARNYRCFSRKTVFERSGLDPMQLAALAQDLITQEMGIENP
jgi:tRNA 2-selenouridine synthase